jgi:hypothetical protein
MLSEKAPSQSPGKSVRISNSIINLPKDSLF